MNTELNTLLITLDVHLDDRILPAIGFSRDHHPGRKPVLNDVELLCLLVAQHLLG
ncbi:MAG: IS982 family transposase, partial [Microbacterium sp.]